MKIILTTSEILAKFGLPADTELVIELGQDQDVDSGEWISNVGRDKYGHPESLDPNTKVEVKTRCGDKHSGIASDWYLSWEEVGEEVAIVAYRILKD